MVFLNLPTMQHLPTLSEVTGPPYAAPSTGMECLIAIPDAPSSWTRLLNELAHLVASQPCAALLRVYSQAPREEHVLQLSCASQAVDYLGRCESVGIFHSVDLTKDRAAFVKTFNDPKSFDDDEACLLSVIQPRPIMFLHAGHQGIDLVCTREDAGRLLDGINLLVEESVKAERPNEKGSA